MDHQSDLRTRSAESRCKSKWCLEAEKHKAKVERLKGKVEHLKETAGRHREKMRKRDKAPANKAKRIPHNQESED